MSLAIATNNRGMRTTVVAGLAAAQQYLTLLAALVAPAGDLDLPSFQLMARFEMGFRGVMLVQSMHGWAVRAAHHFEENDLLAGPRLGNVDGSLESAVAFAEQWVAEDPDHRWAEVGAYDLPCLEATLLAGAV